MSVVVGLVNLDPISGLIKYVTDTKPYHTKLFETLVEYVYTDTVSVSITEANTLDIQDVQTYIESLAAPTNGLVPGMLWWQPNNDGTNLGTLWVWNTAGTAWIQLKINTSNPNPGVTVDTSVTEFVETLAFGWDANYTYNILTISPSTNQITISGNISTVTKPYDFVTISGTASTTNNDGNYIVVSATYDPGTQKTYVILTNSINQNNPNLPAMTGLAGSGGVLTIQNIDVTLWYQFSVISTDPNLTAETLPLQYNNAPTTPVPISSIPWTTTDGNGTNILTTAAYAAATVTQKIVVDGNATTAIQVGNQFQVSGNQNLSGVYHAVTVRYDAVLNQTTIGVGPSVLSPSPFATVTGTFGGGFVEPYRYIGETGGFGVPGYDNPVYDTNPIN